MIDGGYGEKVARYYGDSDMKVICHGVKKEFLDRYDIGKVLADSGLTADAVVATIKNAIK